MAFLSSNLGGGSGMNAARPVSGDRASVGLALDNMIRNQLKVGDPRNPKQVADALLSYYQDLPQAMSIRQEAQGLPFLPQMQIAATPASTAPSSSDREFGIATNDVERALTDLSTSALTNDIIPEMQGWADSIRAAIADGSAASRQGLDPRMRDRVIGIRRQLGEYARLARFVGSLYPGMTQNFRRLGQALDEVSAVLLVMLGEALASVGFANGYYLLQVPLSELQGRRDAVIYALRNFMGGAQQAYGPDDWPRGIDAYRELFNRLEAQGQGDLRTLLVENEVARIMEELITRAQNGSAEGLRALGVTAQLDIERFRRLAIVAPGAGGQQNSPPLAAYLQALLLFADAFTPAGGLRMLRIARPAILLYGLYNAGDGQVDQALLTMIATRGQLAGLLDTLFLGGNGPSVAGQVLFDMLLAALDRAIDLMAAGADGTEQDAIKLTRAYAYWLVIRAILLVFFGDLGQPPQIVLPGRAIELQIEREFNLGSQKAIALSSERIAIQANFGILAVSSIQLTNTLATLVAGFPPPPVLLNPLRSGVAEEMLVQKSLEKRWRELVRSVAPEAARQDIVFDWLRVVIMEAFAVLEALPVAVGHIAPPTPTWDDNEINERRFPPQYEQSLQEIVRKLP